LVIEGQKERKINSYLSREGLAYPAQTKKLNLVVLIRIKNGVYRQKGPGGKPQSTKGFRAGKLNSRPLILPGALTRLNEVICVPRTDMKEKERSRSNHEGLALRVNSYGDQLGEGGGGKKGTY